MRAALREAEENDRKQTTELRRLREELASVQGRYCACTSVSCFVHAQLVLGNAGCPRKLIAYHEAHCFNSTILFPCIFRIFLSH